MKNIPIFIPSLLLLLWGYGDSQLEKLITVPYINLPTEILKYLPYIVTVWIIYLIFEKIVYYSKEIGVSTLDRAYFFLPILFAVISIAVVIEKLLLGLISLKDLIIVAVTAGLLTQIIFKIIKELASIYIRYRFHSEYGYINVLIVVLFILLIIFFPSYLGSGNIIRVYSEYNLAIFTLIIIYLSYLLSTGAKTYRKLRKKYRMKEVNKSNYKENTPENDAIDIDISDLLRNFSPFTKKGLLRAISIRNKIAETTLNTPRYSEIKKKINLSSKGNKKNLLDQRMPLEDPCNLLIEFSQNGNLGEIKSLFKKYCRLDIDGFNKHTGHNPLLTAVMNKQLDVVSYLLAKGANPNAITLAHDASGLAISCQYGSLDIVRLLISYKADVNILDSYGKTPLMNASFYGHINIVSYLIKKGANIELTDIHGMTAYLYAKNNKYGDIMRLLKKSQL